MPVADALLYVVPYLVVLTFVVTVHELGHFLVARGFGIAVDTFSIGFGPTLLSWRDRYGVEWRVAAIPLGGYVKFAGDADATSAVPDQAKLEALRTRVQAHEGAAALPRYFLFRPVWERAAVAAAGPVANFLFSIALFAGLLMAFGDLRISPRISDVLPNSPAARAGFQKGDLITAMNGRPIDDFKRVILVVAQHGGTPVRFTVRRGPPPAASSVDLVATPSRNGLRDPTTGRTTGQPALGVLYSLKDSVRVRFSPAQAVAGGIEQVGDIAGGTVTYLGRIARGLENGDKLQGPVGMARTSHDVVLQATHGETTAAGRAKATAVVLVRLAAFISVALGFANLLPIPVLDGGHLLFYAYEAIARRPAAASVQAVGARVGLVLVLALMLFATWNNLRQPVLQMLGGPLS